MYNYNNCASTTIRRMRRYHDAFDYDGSDRNYDSTASLRYDSDYDPTTTYRARLLPFDVIRREQNMNMSFFRRSRVVVVSQSNRNCEYYRLYCWFVCHCTARTACVFRRKRVLDSEAADKASLMW